MWYSFVHCGDLVGGMLLPDLACHATEGAEAPSVSPVDGWLGITLLLVECALPVGAGGSFLLLAGGFGVALELGGLYWTFVFLGAALFAGFAYLVAIALSVVGLRASIRRWRHGERAYAALAGTGHALVMTSPVGLFVLVHWFST